MNWKKGAEAKETKKREKKKSREWRKRYSNELKYQSADGSYAACVANFSFDKTARHFSTAGAFQFKIVKYTRRLCWVIFPPYLFIYFYFLMQHISYGIN